MTLVAGVNVGQTTTGQPLLDGGCAIVGEDGVRVAVSEERVTRQKYSPGFASALEYCLNYLDADPMDIDRYVFSNCLDRPLSVADVHDHLSNLDVAIPEDRVVVSPSHHRSHACSAFYPSSMSDALILVVDNEGNTLRGEYDRVPLNGLERTSIYRGDGADIELLDRLHDECSTVGIGAAYRYVSKYLGFDSYKDAGKVMGLAAYGEGALSGYRFFDDEWECLIESDPYDRASAVRACLERQGLDPGPSMTDPSDPSKLQIELAWVLQRELERVLVDIVDHYVARTGQRRLCYAGGVALNCVANQRLLEETAIEELFVPPAPGDFGQPLGNALYGYHDRLGHEQTATLTDAYLGRGYDDSAVEAALAAHDDEVTYHRSGDVPATVSEALIDGAIVGHFHGRSEFGPRALGNRSILADPRQASTRDRVNEQVKFREEYRPFAPTVLKDYHDAYFDADWNPPCQFMLLAQPPDPGHRTDIPAVVHENGTSRVQTVTRDQNPRYYDIIDAFRRRTGVPVVLNTSFNLSGDPIVETPTDAISTFRRSGLDTLVLGNYIVQESTETQ